MEQLLREHHDTVRAVCHRIIINDSDAEDATQSALISIVRALPSFDHRSRFSTWVYRIATNAALDELRRIRRRAVPHDDSAFTVLSSNDETPAVDARLDVTRALRHLPEDHRVVLVLRHVADLEYDEIAVILDIPVGTVRSRLSRARAQLAETMGNPAHGSERQTLEQGGPE